MREIPSLIEKKIEKKRFILSSENFSKDKLKKVRKIFEEIKQNFPEVLTINLYGSMTKGYAKPESDIDTIIFLDADKLEEDDLKREKVIQDDFQQNLKLSGINSDCKIFKINEKIIDEGLEDSEKVRQKLTINENQNILPHLGKHYEPIKNLFMGISVGKDINNYRNYLIDKLISQGNKGERIWRGIIDSVRKFERALDEGDDSYKDLYTYELEKAVERYKM